MCSASLHETSHMKCVYTQLNIGGSQLAKAKDIKTGFLLVSGRNTDSVCEMHFLKRVARSYTANSSTRYVNGKEQCLLKVCLQPHPQAPNLLLVTPRWAIRPLSIWSVLMTINYRQRGPIHSGLKCKSGRLSGHLKLFFT